LSHGTLPYWDDDASGKYAEDVLDLLMQHGVYDASNPQDFRRGSNFATQVDLLLKHLGQSDRGAVFSIAGQTYFLPNDVVRYGDREEGYETGAILMKYGAGFPSDVALQSLALHDEMIEDPLRLILTNPGRSRDYHYIRPHQQDPDHLLQLLEIDEELNPVKAKLAIAYAFLHELEKAKQHITRYASTEAFNAVKYFDHNFGKDVDVLMIEDMKIITALTDLLITLYKPGSVHGKVLDIGAGSNPYLSQLVEPFSPQGVLAIDPAPEARDFLEGRNQGRLPSNIASYIDGISEIVRSKGGQWLYDNCEQKLRGRIQVANGSIYSLPEQAYPIIMEGFVAASITKDPGLYMEAIRSKAKALRSQHGSLSIGLEMLERQEWHTGTDQNGQPIRFPSVYVTPDFIKRSHIQAGLECVVIRIGAGEEGDASGGLAQERGQKYAGMAIVISWPKNMSPPSIVTALGRLRRQGFDIID
jgi:hypothetical protein